MFGDGLGCHAWPNMVVVVADGVVVGVAVAVAVGGDVAGVVYGVAYGVGLHLVAVTLST